MIKRVARKVAERSAFELYVAANCPLVIAFLALLEGSEGASMVAMALTIVMLSGTIVLKSVLKD